MSLNSQQHLQGLRAVGLMPNPRPHAKSQKRKLELKCEYCPSTFISNNNLRRHIYELHKDYITHLPAPPEIKCDENLHCRRCDLKFETKLEWIDHKVTEARTTKPYGPFQWGCDLCGAYVSRKEKLINHINNHMKESFIVPVKQQRQQQQQQQQQHAQTLIINTSQHHAEQSMEAAVQVKQEIIETEEMQQQQQENHEAEAESTEEDGSVLSGKGAYGEEATEDYEAVEVDAEVDEDDEADEEDEDDDLDGSSYAPVVNVNENANDGQSADTDEEEEEEEEDEDDDDDDDEDDEEGEIDDVAESEDTTNQSANQVNNNNNMDDSSEAELDETSKDADEDEDMDAEDNTVSSVGDADQASTAKSRFSCDLCQVYFESQPELQQHVKMHFLNGPGSVTFSNKSKQNPRSNNNGSDAVTITTS